MPDVFDALPSPGSSGAASPAGDVFDQVAPAPHYVDDNGKPLDNNPPRAGNVPPDIFDTVEAAPAQLEPASPDAPGTGRLARFAHTLHLDEPFIPLPAAKPNPSDSGWVATPKALYNAGKGFVEFAESPEGVAALGLSAIPGVAPFVAGGFSAQMLHGIPQSYRNARQAAKTGTLQEQIEANLGLWANTTLGTSLGRSAARGIAGMETTAKPSTATPAADRVAASEFAEPEPSPQPSPAKPGEGEAPAAPAKADVFDQVAAKEPLPQPSAAKPGEAAPAPGKADVFDQVTAPAPDRQSVAAVPVDRVPSDAIATRPDLMQFKRIEDSKAGTNKGDELSGKWDDLKGGNLLLWEPNDPGAYGLKEGEKYIVANGHHRFAFGEDQGVPDYNAQIVKESDGVTAQDARRMAAEVNIADGKGTVWDQVKYLREETDPARQSAMAEQLGGRGRQATTIAYQAGKDLMDSFVNEKVTPDKAEAIAKAAPLDRNADPSTDINASLQRLGIRKAMAGAGPQEISNLIQAVRLEAGHMPADQLDLFGANDSALTAAESLAKTAARIQGELSREIKSTDAAARSATTARAKGISFDRPPEQILAENAQLKGERARWDNWALHPDLVAQVRGYAEMKRVQEGGARNAPEMAAAATPPPAPKPVKPWEAPKGEASKASEPKPKPINTKGAIPNEAKQYAKVMPTFQGGKTKMAAPVSVAVRQAWSPSERASISEVHDLFGGGGGWGLFNALAHFPKAVRLVIHEIDVARAEKIKLFHEQGDHYEEIYNNSNVRTRVEDILQKMMDDKLTSANAFAGRLEAVQFDALHDRAIQQSLIDQGKASFGSSGLKNIVRIVAGHAREAFRGAEAFRKRGGKIEYQGGDSYQTQPPAGKHVMVIADPPYYLTKGYDGRMVGLDTYERTRQLLQRLKGQDNNIIYTDEAWWKKTAGQQTDFMAERVLKGIKQSLTHFGEIGGIATRSETLGLNNAFERHGPSGADLERSANGRQAERPVSAAGRVYDRQEQTGGGVDAGTAGEVGEVHTSQPATIDERLAASKIDTQGKVFDVVQGLPVAVWNGCIDALRLAIRAGKSIGQAVEAGLAWIRQNHPGLSFDENQVREKMMGALGVPVRAFGQKVQGSPDVAAETKGGVTDYSYVPKPNEDTAAAAARIVQERGLDNAIDAYKDTSRWQGNGATQSALGKLLIKQMADAERVARASQNPILSKELIKKQVDLIDHDLRRSTDVAQALQAMSLWSRMTPEGIVTHAQRTVQKAGDAVMGRFARTAENLKGAAQQANADALDDFKHDREVNEATRRAVDATVAESPETHRAVIMDLGEAWSKSPVIVAEARRQVAEAAGRILKQNPDPAVPASKRLKIILDDLAARAANIAANHFQGAEPEILLKDKFKQRLGLSEEKAAQMAKAFDSEFARQVAAAKAKLPRTIANARARMQQPFNPADTRDTAVDREIYRQLKERQQKLGDTLNKTAAERDATGKSIGDRVVDAAGLNGDPVQLRAIFNRRWEALVNDRKRAALDRLLANGSMRERKTVRSVWERIVKVSNMGAFEDKRYYDAVREGLHLPVWSAETAAEITRRANDLQGKPEGFQRDQATIDMLNRIEQIKGVKASDLPMAMWYANVLSGVTTPIHVLADNIGSIAGNVLASAIRQPGALPGMARAAVRGVAGGAKEAASILKTGYVTGLKTHLYTSPVLERNPFTGPLSFLNYGKYVGRLLSATHVSTFKPAWEMRSYLAARDAAKTEGLSGPALTQRVADLLANTQERVLAAKTQAAAEGLTGLQASRRTREIIEQQREQAMPGLTDQARDFALRATYLNKPYGAIGWMADKYNEGVQRASEASPALAYIPKLIVPFTRIVSNILNEKLNYTPVGVFRAWKAGESGRLYGQDFDLADPQLKTEQANLYAKAAMGTLAVAGLATLAARYLHDPNPKFAVTGNGPATPEERKQLMQTGWRPNSLKIGDRYVSYARTPVGYGLAVVGNYMDAAKYRHVDQVDALNRVAYAAKGMPQIIIQQSFLEGIGNLLEALQNQNTKRAADGAERWLAKQAGSFVIPNALRQVDRAFDPTVYDSRDVKGMLLSQVPFLRREGQPALNALGQPVKSGVFSYDTSPQTADPVWRLLADKQAWLPALPPEVLVGNKRTDPDSYRALTPDEKYRYVRETGQEIRRQLQDRYYELKYMDDASARAAVEKIARDVHAKARASYR